MTRLSFILPAWKGRFLHQAVASIVAQSCPDWELVVVDDCSPEPLAQILSDFDDPRIRYIRNAQNLGQAVEPLRFFCQRGLCRIGRR